MATESQEAEKQHSNSKEPNASDDNTSAKTSNGQLSWAHCFIIDCIINVIKAIVSVYDVLTLPIYYYRDNVRELRDDVERVRSKFHPDTGTWRQTDLEPIYYMVKERMDAFPTYDAMIDASFDRFENEPCYGYRDVLRVSQVKRRDGSGKVMRQLELSDYRWVTYKEFSRQIKCAMRGFLLEGIGPGDTVMIFADTRPEWQIAAQALIRLGATVGTMYATLGTDGICHSINESNVTHCVTQREFVGRLERLGDRLPKLSKIIYFETSMTPIRTLCSAPFVSKSSDHVVNGDQLMTVTNPTDDISSEKTTTENTTNHIHQNGRVNGAAPNGCVAGAKQSSGCEPLASDRFKMVSFTEMLTRGKAVISSSDQLPAVQRPHNRDQVVVIMYTSGSTGKPKGVVITHGNMLAVIEAFSYVTKDFVHDAKNNTVAAYLPLAHIFEFSIQSIMLFHGVKYGFASPHTLTDKSPGLRPGQRGDFTLLRPTCVIIVPLILDRIVQSVKQALRDQGYFKHRLVSWLIAYKSYWQQRHYQTRVIDHIVCKKIASALGGRAQYVICGSAPLAPETQQFVRAAFNLKLPQGFGTTETSAATSCQLFDDLTTGNVGLPVCNAHIKLEPWDEGQYHPSDKPWPRGEICVGGPMIAAGYYQLPEQTEEAFYTDEQGIRWYRTGDIGAILPNGNLKIIDRKKDLVKLQNGEYISLGKVEATLKSNQYLDNFCAYADSRYNFIVACGPVNEPAVTALAAQLVANSNANSNPNSISNSNSIETQRNQTDRDDRLDELTGLIGTDKVQALKELERLIEERKRLAAHALRRDSSISVASVGSASGTDATGEPSWLARICANPLISSAIYASLKEQAAEAQLLRLEVPRAFLALADEWTAETGLVTAALKIRRAFIYKRYESQLASLYASQGPMLSSPASSASICTMSNQ